MNKPVPGTQDYVISKLFPPILRQNSKFPGCNEVLYHWIRYSEYHLFLSHVKCHVTVDRLHTGQWNRTHKHTYTIPPHTLFGKASYNLSRSSNGIIEGLPWAHWNGRRHCDNELINSTHSNNVNSSPNLIAPEVKVTQEVMIQ